MSWKCKYDYYRYVYRYCVTNNNRSEENIFLSPLKDTVDGLNRTQQRGIEGQLYNKVNELQEELSLKKFDLRAKQLHFAAIKAQVSGSENRI